MTTHLRIHHKIFINLENILKVYQYKEKKGIARSRISSILKSITINRNSASQKRGRPKKKKDTK